MKRLDRLGIILTKAERKNGEDYDGSEEISKQARFQRYSGAGGFRSNERLVQGTAVRHPEAPGVATALRFSIGMARRAALLGGSQGSIARSSGEAAGGSRGRSSGGVWRIRRQHSGGRIRGRHGDAMGSGDMDARGSRRGRGTCKG